MRERERVSKTKVTVSCTHPHHSDTQPILPYSLIRSKSLGPAHTQEERITQGCEYLDAGIIGTISEVPSKCIKSRYPHSSTMCVCGGGRGIIISSFITKLQMRKLAHRDFPKVIQLVYEEAWKLPPEPMLLTTKPEGVGLRCDTVNNDTMVLVSTSSFPQGCR